MQLILDVVAPEMSDELAQAARDCLCSPRQFALECLESVLASRRLPRVYVPPLTQGAQHCRGTRKAGREDEAGDELKLTEHPINFPVPCLETDDAEELCSK